MRQGENRRVYTDSQRQRRYRDHRESRILPQHTRSETHVLHEIFKPLPAPRLAAALSRIHRIPELPIRCVAGFLRLHSPRDQLFLLQFPVQPHLLLQLPLKPPSVHQHPRPSPKFAHLAHYLTALRLFLYLVTSLLRCFFQAV